MNSVLYPTLYGTVGEGRSVGCRPDKKKVFVQPPGHEVAVRAQMILQRTSVGFRVRLDHDTPEVVGIQVDAL
jgi:hypothetical protein